MDSEQIIAMIAEKLRKVQGIEAVVLGGSRARGTHTPSSDIDIGIYYSNSEAIDLIALRAVASEIHDDGNAVLTDIGGWGPWVNGGGWLTVQGCAVDFIYRDLQRVAHVMNQCLTGQVTIDYHPGHPHGYTNALYVSEAAVCHILWDATGTLTDLKARTSPFSPILKQALVDKFLWEADFSCSIAKKGIARLDVSYIAGCCYRAVSCLNQTLFALNETYWMNEKGAVLLLDDFLRKPHDYRNRVDVVFSGLSADAAKLEASLLQLHAIIQETQQLTEANTF
ncbi:nucleotidyltransferase domain-containing protein [Paenibacillus sp. OV219]|uniref:nucleotidyltransferase domain-containing protein n=1 Tax=Paenibacillus sp. OV219 TaxID=1884377 RepID=UPI0008D6CDC7|nr:nucleotidyltransferase domain-containing protein [Paenibacillus sp. OV219]SEO83967.1 Nucleotidyltransferase domain-containing protein [Paenibacillus sp. OV219]